MKVLVYPHDLAFGGSQINAIELAAAVSRKGVDAAIYGHPGPLTERIAELGLDFIPAPTARRRPSPASIAELTAIIRTRSVDVLHGYEWPPILEMCLASFRQPTTVLGTVMSMSVAPFLPHSLPLVVGTPQIADTESKFRDKVCVIEPPVDLDHNDPDRVSSRRFRERWALDPNRLTLVTVTRLANELKFEGLMTLIRSMHSIDQVRPAQLVIVGGGPAEEQVRAAAIEVNRASAAERIVLTGAMADPREAYQAADIVIGMGSSALRALAFAKPLVVQGEQGFWKLLTTDSLELFEWTGWYGADRGESHGAANLMNEIRPVLVDPALRSKLGDFGRTVVEDRYSLDKAAERQIEIYLRAKAAPEPRAATLDSAAAALRYLNYSRKQKLSRIPRRANHDDFNARPVAATRDRRPD